MEEPERTKKTFNPHPEVDKEIDRAIFMLRHGRLVKFLFFLAVFLIVGGVVGWLAYAILVPPPECTLDEHCAKGYYCHEEACVPVPTEKPPEDLAIQIEGTYVFPSVENKVDALAIIKDPDPRWGLMEMKYTFTIKDDSGNEIGSKERISYILPAEEKYLVEVGLPVDGVASSVELSIEPLSWIKVPDLVPPKIDVLNSQFSRETNIGNARIDGRLVNSSQYNLEEIEVTSVLFDSNDVPVGANYTTLNALFSGEERDFSLIWFADVGEVADDDVRVESNIFDTENFVKEMQGDPELYQLYEEPESD